VQNYSFTVSLASALYDGGWLTPFPNDDDDDNNNNNNNNNNTRRTVLLEKPTLPQLVTKFPTFYETRMFITAFTTARHLSLS
jgi:hypothetical protein